MRIRTALTITLLTALAAGGYWLLKSRPLVDASDRQRGQTDLPELPANQRRVILAEGQFHNVAHTGAGTATIYRNPDGKTILRFGEFETAPAEDLQVCLVAASDAQDDRTVHRAGFIVIAPLQAMMGDQVYELPANLDLARYRAVTILSRHDGVNFATAPLE